MSPTPCNVLDTWLILVPYMWTWRVALRWGLHWSGNVHGLRQGFDQEERILLLWGTHRKIHWGDYPGVPWGIPLGISQTAGEQRYFLFIFQRYFLECIVTVVQSLSHVWLFADAWTVARQAPLSIGFPRQEYWSGLPFPPPGDLSSPGTEPESAMSPTWQIDSLPLCHLGSPDTLDSWCKR